MTKRKPLPNEKICAECRSTLDKSLFYKSKKNKDGFSRACGECKRKRAKRIRAKRSYEKNGRHNNLPPTFHGMSRTSEYMIWNGMKGRCNNPHEDSWPHYGGRGVKVYGPWEKSFMEFYNYLGPRPSPDHSIDRINNDGHYEPGNVRWATMEQQLSNRSEYGVLVKVTVPLKKPDAPYAFDYDFSRKLSKWRNLHSRVEEVGLLSKGRVFVLYKGSDRVWKKETIEMAGQIGEVVKDSGGRWLVDFKPRKIWISPERLTLLPCVSDLREAPSA